MKSRRPLAKPPAFLRDEGKGSVGTFFEIVFFEKKAFDNQCHQNYDGGYAQKAIAKAEAEGDFIAI